MDTLYDELLNVPYIPKMPGIEVGMDDEPVSAGFGSDDEGLGY